MVRMEERKGKRLWKIGPSSYIKDCVHSVDHSLFGAFLSLGVVTYKFIRRATAFLFEKGLFIILM
jgi:hypothetical protein